LKKLYKIMSCVWSTLWRK